MITDTFKNTFAPINVMDKTGVDRLIGNVEIVALEVAISKLMRWGLRMAPRGVMELALIHTISMGLLGGLSAPFDHPKQLDGDAKFTDALFDGAKMVPAVFAAQYVASVARQGLHLGIKQISIKDLLITAASKAITRPLINLVYKQLPNKMKQGIDEHGAMVEQQALASRLRSKGN